MNPVRATLVLVGTMLTTATMVKIATLVFGDDIQVVLATLVPVIVFSLSVAKAFGPWVYEEEE